MDTVTSTIASAVYSPKILLRLRGYVNDYDWGKSGTTSLVAQLASEAVGPDFKVDPKHTYAELWAGTHPSGPASIFSEWTSTLPPLSSLVSLSSLIQAHPEHYLGGATLQKFPTSREVPYLFKILSIAKALPLQAHPDKGLGVRLHQRDPKEFPDTNHKPEIAVSLGGAVSDAFGGGDDVAFTGFVGFRPLDHIANALRNVPELRHVVANQDTVDTFISAPSKEGLKALYTALLLNGKENPKRVAEHAQALVTRINSQGLGTDLLDSEVTGRLVVKINEQYRGDVGVFAVPFFMNLVRLKQGESIYIGADEIHAYLEGNIIECMAVSDNVTC
jgi:mannose-6-phosphate isomerase